MVRHYKRKNEKTYSEQQIQKAVDDVRNKKMTTYAAAAFYQIPRSTLNTRLTCIRDTPGRPTVFSTELEKRIAECLHLMEKQGFPLTRKEASILISEYVRRNGIHTPFKNDIPGKDWFYAFQNRNNLSIKKPQAVEMSRRKACDPFIVYGYFDILARVVEELDLKDKPHRIYNLDETSMCDDPVKGKVIGKKGFRSTRTTSGPGRNNTTVLLATNACGDKLPALIIFQGKNLWTQWLYPNENVKTAYAVSEKGWMETTIFEKYLRDVFVPLTKGERPLLLIFDGHSTHVDLSVIEYAASEGITIIKLPAHSSHVLQPLDCSTMKPLKDKWEDEVIKWQRLNIGSKLPKPEFARILTKIWDEINPVIIQNGFRKTGAYPVDRNAIPKQLFDSLKWERWEAFQSQNDLISTYNKETSESAINETICTVPRLMILTLEKINNMSFKANQGLQTGIHGWHLEADNHVIEKELKDRKVMQAIHLIENKEKQYCIESTKGILTTNTTSSVPTNMNISYTMGKNNLIKLPVPKRMLENQCQSRLNILEVKIVKPSTEINETVPFESLLLKTIAKSDPPVARKKRVTNSKAEVLTYKCVLDRIKKEKEEKENKVKNKGKRKMKANAGPNNNKQKRPKLEIKHIIKKEDKPTKTKENKKRKGHQRNKKIKDFETDSNSSASYMSVSESENEETLETFFDNILKNAEHEEKDDTPTENMKTMEEAKCFAGQEIKILSKKDAYATRQVISKATPTQQLHDVEEPIASTSKEQTTPKQIRHPRKGTFIVAKFSSLKGKRKYKYVCLVEDVTAEKIVVLGLKSKGKTKTVFRIVENDYSIIDKQDIVEFLPKPKLLNNQEYVFPCKVEVLEL